MILWSHLQSWHCRHTELRCLLKRTHADDHTCNYDIVVTPSSEQVSPDQKFKINISEVIDLFLFYFFSRPKLTNGRTTTGFRKRRLVGITFRRTELRRQPFGSLLISRSSPEARSWLEEKRIGICISPELPMMYIPFFLLSNRDTNFFLPAMFFYRVVCVSILFYFWTFSKNWCWPSYFSNYPKIISLYKEWHGSKVFSAVSFFTRDWQCETYLLNGCYPPRCPMLELSVCYHTPTATFTHLPPFGRPHDDLEHLKVTAISNIRSVQLFFLHFLLPQPYFLWCQNTTPPEIPQAVANHTVTVQSHSCPECFRPNHKELGGDWCFFCAVILWIFFPSSLTSQRSVKSSRFWSASSSELWEFSFQFCSIRLTLWTFIIPWHILAAQHITLRLPAPSTIILIKRRTTTNTLQHPSQMIYSIYRYASTLGARRSRKARKAAFEAVDLCLKERGGGIKRRFGNLKWVVVL